MDTFSRVAAAIAGDAFAADLQPRVRSYEEVHGSVQDILVPDMPARGVSMHVLQPMNRNFALSHRMVLETTLPGQDGGGPGGQDAHARDHRIYSFGGVLSGVLAQDASEAKSKFRLSAALDNRGVSKTTALVDAYGDGRLRVQAQCVDNPKDGVWDWALSTFIRGADWAATVRALEGPRFGASYNQRLAPGSPLTLGGEMYLSVPALHDTMAGTTAPFAATSRKPLEWSIGAAYDTQLHKSALHVDMVDGRGVTLSAHHLTRVTERAHLAAKFIHDTYTKASMMAAGYRLKFRNTQTTVTGMFDSYGTAKLVLEREPIKDVRFTFGAHCNFWPPSPAERAQESLSMQLTGRGRVRPDKFRFGLLVQLGTPPPITVPQSPCTMSKDILGAR